jgi:hypothetical protein
MSNYGPIKIMNFDVTKQWMLMKQPNWSVARLEKEVKHVLRRIGSFDSTFDHCRYIRSEDINNN